MSLIPENLLNKSALEIANYAFYYRRSLWTFLYAAKMVGLCSEASFACFCTKVNKHTHIILSTIWIKDQQSS